MSSKDCKSCKKNNQNRKMIGFTDFNCEMILFHPSKYRFYENFYPDCFDTFSLPMKFNALLSEVFFRKYLIPLCFFNPNCLYTTIYLRFLKTNISYHRLIFGDTHFFSNQYTVMVFCHNISLGRIFFLLSKPETSKGQLISKGLFKVFICTKK